MTGPPGISRRKLLAATVGVGAVGTVIGAEGARAFLHDRETLAGLLEAGRIDLAVTCSGDADCTADGDSVEFDLGDVTPGDCGSVDLCLEVDDNPAWLWAAADCPTADTPPVASYLHARLTDENGDPVLDANGDPIEGTLADVLAQLAGGIRIDADPDTTAIDPAPPATPVCLRLEWGAPLPAQTGTGSSTPYDCDQAISFDDLIASDDLGFTIEFVATQRRHDDDPTTPFETIDDCGDLSDVLCLDCRFLGKHDVEDDHLTVGESYPLLEVDDQPTGYELLVTGLQNNQDDETFALTGYALIEAGTAADPRYGPAMCNVAIGGGARPRGGGRPVRGESPNEKERVSICPPASTSDDRLTMPDEKAISNVVVYVCDEGELPDCYTTEATK